MPYRKEPDCLTLSICAVSKSRGALMPAGWLSLLYISWAVGVGFIWIGKILPKSPLTTCDHPNPTGRQHEASLTSFKAHLRPKERCEDFCRLDTISIDNWQPWQRHQTHAGWNPEQDPGKETPSILRKLQFHTCYLGFNGCVSRLGDQLVVQQQVMSTPAMELETGIGAAERPQELERVPEDRHCTAFKGVVKHKNISHFHGCAASRQWPTWQYTPGWTTQFEFLWNL